MPRVDVGVKNVDSQVYGHERHGNQEGRRLQYRIVPLKDRRQVVKSFKERVRARLKLDFARANTVKRGKDHLGEATLGVLWRFRPLCQVRTQLALSRNDSNIEIYDYNRSEISTAVRCEMN